MQASFGTVTRWCDNAFERLRDEQTSLRQPPGDDLVFLREEPTTRKKDKAGNERLDRRFGHGHYRNVQKSGIQRTGIAQIADGAVRSGLAENGNLVAIVDLAGQIGIGTERPVRSRLASGVPEECAESCQRIIIAGAGKNVREGVPGDARFIPIVVAQQIELKATGGDFVESGICWLYAGGGVIGEQAQRHASHDPVAGSVVSIKRSVHGIRVETKQCLLRARLSQSWARDLHTSLDAKIRVRFARGNKRVGSDLLAESGELGGERSGEAHQGSEDQKKRKPWRKKGEEKPQRPSFAKSATEGGRGERRETQRRRKYHSRNWKFWIKDFKGIEAVGARARLARAPTCMIIAHGWYKSPRRSWREYRQIATGWD